jgi:predicted nucleotidyltransferase
MTPLLPDLREFLRLLNDHHVEYLLIGGYAVSYHGYVRSTADMDIWIAMNPENAQRMVELLRAFGFGATGLSTDLFLHPHQITRMGHAPVRIEILTTVSGLDFTEAYAQRVVDIIDGIPVSVISREHLEINKRAAGRTKDLADLDNLP